MSTFLIDAPIANCRTVDPDLHHPIGSAGPAVLQALQAIKVCRNCPLIDACRADADKRKPDDEIAGGYDYNLRRRRATSKYLGEPMEERPARPARPNGVDRTGRPPVAPDERAEIKHGTAAGYAAHLRRDEDACADCRRAHTEEHRAAAQKRPKKTQIHGNTVRVLDAVIQYATTDARVLAKHLHLEAHKVTRCLQILRDKGLLEDQAVAS